MPKLDVQIDDVVVRVRMRSSADGRRAGEHYLVTVGEAKPLLAMGLLEPDAEIPDVGTARRAEIAKLFEPPAPAPAPEKPEDPGAPPPAPAGPQAGGES